MMSESLNFFNIQPLRQQLDDGELILTSNQRLASRISNAYVQVCQDAGHRVINTPNIHSLSNWAMQCWEQLLLDAYEPAIRYTLLNTVQERQLWQKVISESDAGALLLRPDASAQQAAAAYRLLAEWQLDTEDKQLQAQFGLSDDTQVWLQWAKDLRSHCEQHGLLLSADLVALLGEASVAGCLAPEQRITLVGFQDLAPAWSQLLEGIAERLEVYQSPAEAANGQRVSCETTEHEWLSAAIWAKQVLKHEPGARVAIVVPELTQQRQRLERILMAVFEPGYNHLFSTAEDEARAHEQPRRAVPFNMSAGTALLDTPIIAAALDCFALTGPDIELVCLERFLQSPFTALDSADHSLIASCLQQCRNLRSTLIPMSQLRHIVTRLSEQQAETGGDVWHFAERLLQLLSLTRASQLHQKCSHELWSSWFQEVLEVFDWPGRRPLDSIEYQQVVQWQSALEQFQSLQLLDADSISLSQALSQLRTVLSQQIFQPQTAESPLQVLGVLEAAGLEFSHLWLSSMSSQQWPAPASPNPFIPMALQREKGMPHASAQREFNYARQLTELFAHSAKQLVISSPETLDENPVSHSSLFAAYPLRSLKELLGRPWQHLDPITEAQRRIRESRKTEVLNAGTAPAVLSEEFSYAGTAILTDQSACAFRAFTKHRLRCDALDEVSLGLSAAERGQLLHRALELLWRSLKTRAELAALSDQERLIRCEQASQYAVEQLAAKAGKTIGARFCQLEAKRLTRLLQAWLEIEFERDDFTVQAMEERRDLQLGGLAFSVRIDRIDQLSDGSYAILDYKSGSCSPQQWWGERPEQPQLPLYALMTETVNDAPVNAIAFAEINNKNCRLRAVGSEDNPESQFRWQGKLQSESGQQSWPLLRNHWQRVLQRLIGEFLSGQADIDPKYDPVQSLKTCQYCRQQSACRVFHQQLSDQALLGEPLQPDRERS